MVQTTIKILERLREPENVDIREEEKMEEIIRQNAELISQIIENTEYVQQSNESEYTKERCKVTAYDEIVRLIRGKDE